MHTELYEAHRDFKKLLHTILTGEESSTCLPAGVMQKQEDRTQASRAVLPQVSS
jgi:hypothetical protein